MKSDCPDNILKENNRYYGSKEYKDTYGLFKVYIFIGCVSKPLYPGPILVYFCNLGPGLEVVVVGAKPCSANSSETKKIFQKLSM